MKTTRIYFLLTLLSVVALSSCKKNNSHLINYTTQGSPTTVTYTDQNGNTQTVNNPASNWTLSFSTTDNGMTVKLTAVDAKGGNVGGKIFIDANQSAQSNGTSSSISISALVP